MKCPFLNMPDSELAKLAPQFREEVAQDATKCIEHECSSFNEGVCMRQPTMPVFHLKVGNPAEGGLGTYGVEDSMLANNQPVLSTIFSENLKPEMTARNHVNFTIQANNTSEVVESMRHLVDAHGEQLVISKRSRLQDN